jgi:2'-5' RNA ligase
MPEQAPHDPGTDLLTLRLDTASQAFFDQMRQQYFPPERNLIAAHVTLFHTLPQVPEITAALEAAAARTASYPVYVTGLRSLGRGVAYKLESPELMVLHRDLSVAFSGCLTAQDRQKFQPHVVIQNKVTAARAKSLMAILEPQFRSFDVHAQGLDLWHYMGGPWEHARTFLFSR